MRKGFTLVEILTTVAIIAILSSIALGTYGKVRSKTRDAIRMADIKQIQKAVENYYSVCFQFPNSYLELNLTSSQSDNCPAYTPVLNKIPMDPRGDAYLYFKDTSANEPARYHLCALLENNFTGSGKAGKDNVVSEDGCDGSNIKIFDAVGGAD